MENNEKKNLTEQETEQVNGGVQLRIPVVPVKTPVGKVEGTQDVVVVGMSIPEVDNGPST